MSWKTFHVCAISCVALGCIMLIVAISSASWMVACMKYDNIFKAMKGFSSEPMTEEQKDQFDLGVQMLKGTDFCVHHGLLKLTMAAGNIMNVNMGIDITSMPRSTMFGAFILVVALVLGVIGGIILIVAIGGEQGSYDGKSKVAQRTRSGLIVLTVAGICTVIGMAAYTGGTAQAVHNPLLFMASMGQSLSSVFQQQLPMGRGKRDISLDGLGLDEDMKQMMSTMFEGMDPMYGYAFYLGWVSAVFLVISAIFTGVAKQSLLRQPYAGASSVKL
ncbi:uncharacterized protein LOC120341055 [Styela clava]